MIQTKLILKIFPKMYSICRLNPQESLPTWVDQNDFYSITKTDEELSLVAREDLVPHHIKAEKNWRVLKVQGPLDFSLVGVLSSLTNPLAKAQISLFAISTFDTDYLLIKDINLEQAQSVLLENGFLIDEYGKEK